MNIDRHRIPPMPAYRAALRAASILGVAILTGAVACSSDSGTSSDGGVDSGDGGGGDGTTGSDGSGGDGAPNDGPSLPPGTANLWVDTDGGSCKRYDPPGAYVDSEACASISDAYNNAQEGDRIYVKAGTYGSQTIPKRSLGTTVVVIAKEPGGGAVNLSGDLEILSPYTYVDGFTGTDANSSLQVGSNEGCSKTPGNGWPCLASTHDVTVTNFAFKTVGINADYLLLQHGDVGPHDVCTQGGIEDGIQLSGQGPGVDPSFSPCDHVTIDDVTVHDIMNSGCGNHVDGIQGFGYRHFTVRNSRIYNTDSSLILAYSFDNSNPGQVDGILIENNAFGDVPHPGHGITLGNDGSSGCGADNLNNIIQNNTFYGGSTADVACAGSPDAIFRNNIVVNSAWSCFISNYDDFQWDYNTFESPASDCMSTPHAKQCSPTYVDSSHANGNVDLDPSDTCAKDYAPTTAGTFPATDIHGTSRPQGSGVDVGAYEAP